MVEFLAQQGDTNQELSAIEIVEKSEWLTVVLVLVLEIEELVRKISLI